MRAYRDVVNGMIDGVDLSLRACGFAINPSPERIKSAGAEYVKKKAAEAEKEAADLTELKNSIIAFDRDKPHELISLSENNVAEIMKRLDAKFGGIAPIEGFMGRGMYVHLFSIDDNGEPVTSLYTEYIDISNGFLHQMIDHEKHAAQIKDAVESKKSRYDIDCIKSDAPANNIGKMFGLCNFMAENNTFALTKQIAAFGLETTIRLKMTLLKEM